MTAKAIVGIGVPGSGKTTLLKPLAAQEDLAYINRDDIREELTGDPTNHTKEPLVTRLMYQRIKDGLRRGGVVIDGTHSKPGDRKKVVQFSRENGAQHVTGYWVRVPLQVALQRNAARRRLVPEEAVANMARRLELNPPSLEEGFDEIIEVA